MTYCDAERLSEGVIDDGRRGTNLDPKLARGGAANAQAQRHSPGALCARSGADDADQEYSRRSALHDLPHRARGRGGRHRFRGVAGRPGGRPAYADPPVYGPGECGWVTPEPPLNPAVPV